MLLFFFHVFKKNQPHSLIFILIIYYCTENHHKTYWFKTTASSICSPMCKSGRGQWGQLISTSHRVSKVLIWTWEGRCPLCRWLTGGRLVLWALDPSFSFQAVWTSSTFMVGGIQEWVFRRPRKDLHCLGNLLGHAVSVLLISQVWSHFTKRNVNLTSWEEEWHQSLIIGV
jgi:hypothetical protein